MNQRILLLLGALLAAGVLFSSCIRVPIELPKNPFQVENPKPEVANPSDDTGIPGKSRQPGEALTGPAKAMTVEEAKAAWESAKRVYTDAKTYLVKAEANLKGEAIALRDVKNQAVGDRIVRDGWGVFVVGMVGSLVGVFFIAKQYGTGGWWILLGGSGVAVFGLTMIWLGPHWLNITRGAVALSLLAMVVGSIYAWRKRNEIKASLRSANIG